MNSQLLEENQATSPQQKRSSKRSYDEITPDNQTRWST